MTYVLGFLLALYAFTYWLIGFRAFDPAEPEWLPWLALALSVIMTDDQ